MKTPGDGAAEPGERTPEGVEQAPCARCKAIFPADSLELLTGWTAVVFGTVFRAWSFGSPDVRDELGLQQRYCPACRRHLACVVGIFVYLFGGLLLIVAIAKLAELLAP